MYFNYTKYIPIVFQLQNTNYFCQGHKIQNTLNVFKIHVFQLLQHWGEGTSSVLRFDIGHPGFKSHPQTTFQHFLFTHRKSRLGSGFVS